MYVKCNSLECLRPYVPCVFCIGPGAAGRFKGLVGALYADVLAKPDFLKSWFVHPFSSSLCCRIPIWLPALRVRSWNLDSTLGLTALLRYSVWVFSADSRGMSVLCWFLWNFLVWAASSTFLQDVRCLISIRREMVFLHLATCPVVFRMFLFIAFSWHLEGSVLNRCLFAVGLLASSSALWSLSNWCDRSQPFSYAAISLFSAWGLCAVIQECSVLVSSREFCAVMREGSVLYFQWGLCFYFQEVCLRDSP